MEENRYYALQISYDLGDVAGRHFFLKSRNELSETSDLVRRKIEKAHKKDFRKFNAGTIERINLSDIKNALCVPCLF